MAIEFFNPTMNQFVNWANQDGIGKSDLVHATATQETAGNEKVAIAANKNDGTGFFAWRRRSADVKNMNDATRDLFRQAVMDLFGAKTIDDVPKSVRDKMKLGDYGNGHPLSAHRIRSVAKAARLALASKAFTADGAGEGASAVKGALNAKLATFRGSKNDKAVALKNEMDRNAKNRFNLFFAADMKDMQEGRESQFEKDHNRLIVAPKFKIGNETLTFDRDTPLREKQDIIAKFVRKDTDARFADLQGADLNKAYAVMSFVAQRFAFGIQEAVTKSLAAGKADEPPILIGQPQREASKSPLTFSFGDDGSLRVHFDSFFDNPQISHDSRVGGKTVHKVFEGFEQGSSVTIAADFEIGAEELETIANADYTPFDHTVATAEMHGQLGEDEAGVAAMGPFRFGPGVKASVSCSFALNGGALMMETEF